MCQHKTCQKLRQNQAAQSVGITLLVHYYQKDWVLGVGKERGGTYAGTFNLCAGKGEQSDYDNGQFCWLKCVVREFYEEFKINAPLGKSFDAYFKGSAGRIRFFMHKKTPIFVAVGQGIKRASIANQMIADIRNPLLPHSQKEMDDFEWIRVDNGYQVEGKRIPVSSFADSVRQKIDLSKL